MTASFSLALQAASAAAGSQHYPQATLYVVATPIGNLADIGLRALHVLNLADTLACEDTRHTQTLLRAYGIDRPGAHWLAAHEHNEMQAAESVLERLRAGQRVAYVSDAGTPAVSDPGARLVAVVRDAGFGVVPLPGASSVTTVLSVAGISDPQSLGFRFIGFLPSKSRERETAVAALAAEPGTCVLLESPHRIEALAHALAVLGERAVTVGRELTKQFESITTVAAQALPDWLAADANRRRGEFVLVLHPLPVASSDADEAPRVLRLLLAEGLPVKTAVKLCVDITGAPRNGLYELALQIRSADQGEASAPDAADGT